MLAARQSLNSNLMRKAKQEGTGLPSSVVAR
jgi:hypothetical protein